jgi:hypothetical protein
MSTAEQPVYANPNPVWPRPTIVPLPDSTAGVANPVILINGTWKMHPNPPQGFWRNEISPASWSDVPVPGYTETQGYDLPVDHEYAYRTRLSVPADYAGQRILLRFDGVTGYARVWLDGEALRDHYGGFTSWDVEITGRVNPGGEAWLTVGVTDKPQEISCFNLGGIIRNVALVAVPLDHLTRLHVGTDLDDACRDATLRVTAAMAFASQSAAEVRLTLSDPQGQAVAIEPGAIGLSSAQPEATVAIPLASPQKWDAEHPRLYTLRAAVVVDGQEIESLSKQVGFRRIEVRGNKLLISGQEAKLRGACRHDIHPQTGRAITPQLVEQDVQLFRAANINFVRTSHYPPREDFLEACDRAGIFVEDEIAVAFVYQGIQPTENDPQFTAGYMNQFAEMIERDRDHPCVIMWSLANESYWGRNFQLEYDYARAEDPSRPLIFSYPITMPEGTQPVDIWSLHYAEYGHDPAEMEDNHSVGQAWGKRAPVLHDEYAHLPCYDLLEQRRDPAVREFWGESIKRFWEAIATTEGALGGAIWGGIDDCMITSQGFTAWEWGIIDGWRRQKPEYWLLKKAYSPIRIADAPLPVPGRGQALRLPIANWFDHTNLQEVAVHWAVGAERGVVAGPDVPPHGAGVLELAARDWREGEVLNLRFYRPQDLLLDEYNLPLGGWQRALPGPQGPAPRFAVSADTLTVWGAGFRLVFSQRTGLLTSGTCGEREVLCGGPHLHLVGVDLAPWSLQSLHARTEGCEAVVDIRGSYGPVVVHFEVRVDGQGLISTRYTLDKFPVVPPRSRRLAVGVDVGGFREVGLSYTLPGAVDRLNWERKGLWSAYPEGHIGRSAGTAHRLRQSGAERYGAAPTWPWAEDMRTYPLFGRYDVGGRGTNDFRSMKHGIWQATALLAGTGCGVRAESDGSDAVRLEVLDDPRAKIDDRDPQVRLVGTWVPMDGEPESYCRTEMYSNKAGDYAEFTFNGTGVCWIGSKDLIMGQADVYVDGRLAEAGLDLYSGRGHGAARGEEKIYQWPLFSVEGLPAGEHTIKVVVTGVRNPRSNNAYVSVDAFLILGSGAEGQVQMNILNAWNYPEITWGNYVKPAIFVAEGYSNTVRLRLTDQGAP